MVQHLIGGCTGEGEGDVLVGNVAVSPALRHFKGTCPLPVVV